MSVYADRRSRFLRPNFFWQGLLRSATLPLILLVAMFVSSCSSPDVPSLEDGELAVEAEAPEITLNGPGQLLPVSAIATMNGESIELEIAETPQQQSLGLMFRSQLPDNRGMLFPFPQPRRARFWMKDVPVPLDMVFLRNSEVIEIAAEVPPCANLPCPSYGPEQALVDQVIELRSGRAAEIGLQPGDTVTLSPVSP
ncbi:MAG: DUF192 domain-containing protein [Cyanobacteria bacterium J06555_13]